MTVSETTKRDDKVRCEACPIRCRIAEGRTGACDRYGNVDGVLTRMSPEDFFSQYGYHPAAGPALGVD